MIKIEDFINNKDKLYLTYHINKGYGIASKFLNQPLFKNFLLGRDHESNLIRLAVDFSLYKACKSNDLPFKAKIEFNAKKNCRHIELIGENKPIIITTNKTKDWRQIPRDAIFRNKHADNNQLEFFEKTPEIACDKTYACITHGSSENEIPNFITFGIPDNDMKHWIDSRNILNDIHLASINNLESEFEADDLNLEFKNFIKKLKVSSNDKK